MRAWMALDKDGGAAAAAVRCPCSERIPLAVPPFSSEARRGPIHISSVTYLILIPRYFLILNQTIGPWPIRLAVRLMNAISVTSEAIVAAKQALRPISAMHMDLLSIISKI